MKNQDKLQKCYGQFVRLSIVKFGVWKGIALYHDEHKNKNILVHCTLTNIASLHNPNLLEFYNLS